jgi:hypothetical protein
MINLREDTPSEDLLSQIRSLSFFQSKVKIVKYIPETKLQVFLVETANGNKYKLRICPSENLAKLVEQIASKIPHVFPTFYGRFGNFLLFKWIVGTALDKNISIADAQKLGRLVRDINALNSDSFTDLDKTKYTFRECALDLDLLEESVSNPQMSQLLNGLTLKSIKALKEKYLSLKAKLKPDVVLEYVDSQPKNFIMDEAGDIFCIDEFGFLFHVRGMSTPSIFGQIFAGEKKQELINAFASEYERDLTLSSDKSIFSADYKLLLEIAHCAIRAGRKILNNKLIEDRIRDQLINLAVNK